MEIVTQEGPWTIAQAIASMLAALVAGFGLYFVWRQLRSGVDAQAMAVVLPLYDKWRFGFEPIRTRLANNPNLSALSPGDEIELRRFLGHLELLCILIKENYVRFKLADEIWPTSLADTYRVVEPFVTREREQKPFFAQHLGDFVNKQRAKHPDRLQLFW